MMHQGFIPHLVHLHLLQEFLEKFQKAVCVVLFLNNMGVVFESMEVTQRVEICNRL